MRRSKKESEARSLSRLAFPVYRTPQSLLIPSRSDSVQHANMSSSKMIEKKWKCRVHLFSTYKLRIQEGEFGSISNYTAYQHIRAL
jgi:hypothetical protein